MPFLYPFYGIWNIVKFIILFQKSYPQFGIFVKLAADHLLYLYTDKEKALPVHEINRFIEIQLNIFIWRGVRNSEFVFSWVTGKLGVVFVYVVCLGLNSSYFFECISQCWASKRFKWLRHAIRWWLDLPFVVVKFTVNRSRLIITILQSQNTKQNRIGGWFSSSFSSGGVQSNNCLSSFRVFGNWL